MAKRFRVGCLGLVLVVVVLMVGLATFNSFTDSRLRSLKTALDYLTAEEKAILDTTVWLRQEAGNAVWPGFNSFEAPMVAYNEGYEFLLNSGSLPGWEPVGDEWQGKEYYRRLADDPQAFAVMVGSLWAGSMCTLNTYNVKGVRAARQQLPPLIAQLLPTRLLTIDEAMVTVAVNHEQFHAFQATYNPQRFDAAMESYSYEQQYPYDDKAFREAWDEEGSLLWEAMQTTDDATARELTVQFLETRDARREAAALDDGPLAFECNIEWLEGLAKYVERSFYLVAADTPELSGFSKDSAYLTQELKRLKSGLGGHNGDFRFYLSGMAQATLLDRFSPGWKERALLTDVSLDELLREAVSPQD